MNIAIIGAGASGLACALQLKKYDIIPVIFEKRGQIGDSVCGSCLSFRNLLRHQGDPFQYIKNQYGLSLKPLNPIKDITICSANHSVTARGHLGHFLGRGYTADSIDGQLFRQAALPVQFNQNVRINEIRDSFDKIVVATGNSHIAKEMKVWNRIFFALARIAIIKGTFNPYASKIWFQTEFANNGFAYMAPVNDKSAVLGLVVNNITGKEMDHYWEKFLEMKGLNYTITETKDLEHECGTVIQNTHPDIYYTGNSAGCTDSFIGVGLINAIESGILAAEAIVKGMDYPKLIQPIIAHNEKLYQYRKCFNTFTNKELDALIKTLGYPGMKNVIYKNPLFRVTSMTPLLRAYNHMKGQDALFK